MQLGDDRVKMVPAAGNICLPEEVLKEPRRSGLEKTGYAHTAGPTSERRRPGVGTSRRPRRHRPARAAYCTAMPTHWLVFSPCCMAAVKLAGIGKYLAPAGSFPMNRSVALQVKGWA